MTACKALPPKPIPLHIIIDGDSTDSTLAIVRTNSPTALILSEPDMGIYDAMNEGIILATGDVVGILNADDFYTSPDVLARVAQAFEDPAAIIFRSLHQIRQ